VEIASSPEEVAVLHPPTDEAPRWRLERDAGSTRVVFDRLDVYAVVVAKTN
jgi:hypothetical protein